MLIGASRCPWECEQKGLTLTYQKMMVLPIPDYSFRSCLWKELILSKGGQITKHDSFDVSSLAKVSEGYPSGHIVQTINNTMTERRVLQQKMRPLQPVEFISHLAKFEPIYREEQDAYYTWVSKLMWFSFRSPKMCQLYTIRSLILPAAISTHRCSKKE